MVYLVKKKLHGGHTEQLFTWLFCCCKKLSWTQTR